MACSLAGKTRREEHLSDAIAESGDERSGSSRRTEEACATGHLYSGFRAHLRGPYWCVSICVSDDQTGIFSSGSAPEFVPIVSLSEVMPRAINTTPDVDHKEDIQS